MSVTRFIFAIAFVSLSTLAQAKDEVHTPHRLLSGRILEIVTNDETGYIGWLLKDRSYHELSYGALKGITMDESKVDFENPLGWDIKIDIAALKFANRRRVVLFVKDHLLKRGPEIEPVESQTTVVRKEFDFKLLKREKKIRVMNYADPKKPEIEKTYVWKGKEFSE